MTTPALGTILYAFFEDYLKRQKGLSATSIKSYRDGIRLFLNFAAQETHRKITHLTLSDLTAEHVLHFLTMLEKERHNHIRTRNQRLSMLHIYFEYMATQAPEVLGEAQKVAAIPMKRTGVAETFYLERDQIEALFKGLPTNQRFSLRDRALLLLLYNTGARVQEIADLKVINLDLSSSPCLHLHGKGDKWRVCPLWKETASLLKQLLDQDANGQQADRCIFQSLQKKPLTRYGIYKIVRRHTENITIQGANQKFHKISPHVFRHTTAVHLMESGVELNVIRGWLGHASLETTHRYAEINIRMKEKALAMCEPPASCVEGFPRKAVWKDDPSLLKWLKSL